MSDAERELVERASRRDAGAFAELYDRHLSGIYKYIYFKVGGTPEAEDLTAQVFLKAWQALPNYRWTVRPFSAWLFRIAHNLVVDHFRVRREPLPIQEIEGVEDAQAKSPQTLVEESLNAERVRAALRTLTDDQQQVIVLRFLHGYSSEEVAHLMGRDSGAVRALQHRGLTALRRIFQGGPDA